MPFCMDGNLSDVTRYPPREAESPPSAPYADGVALTGDDVVAHVRAHLAGYKKPARVCFLPELLRTAASRQVHKPLLRELVLRERR